MSKERRIRAHYEHRITADRQNYDVLDWASAESQATRFVVLAENVDLAGKSLLDVGCGLGDLLAFCTRLGIEVDYTGVDLLAKMVRAAQGRHPDGRFVQGDIFESDPFDGRQFDVVFCSGALNLNLGNNREFLPVAVSRMLSLCRGHVVVNLLRRMPGFHDRTYFCHDPDDVRELLRPLPCDIRILQDYLPNDFTVFCQKTVGDSPNE